MKNRLKQILPVFLALALCGAVLTACEANAAVPAEDSASGQLQEVRGEGAPPDMQDGTVPDGEAPNFPADSGTETSEEVLTEGQTQITGKVTSVVGNEIKLSLGSYGGIEDQNTVKNASGDAEAGTAEKPGVSDTESVAGVKAAGSFEQKAVKSSAVSGEIPSEVTAGSKTLSENTDTSEGSADSSFSGTPSAESAEGDSGTDSGSATSSDNANSSGEARNGQSRGSNTFTGNGITQTLQVPVGLTLSGSSGGSRSQDYSSITAGMILRITLESEEDGSELIVAVRVVSK